MKKFFETLELRILSIEDEDIITKSTSGTGGHGGGLDGWGNGGNNNGDDDGGIELW